MKLFLSVLNLGKASNVDNVLHILVSCLKNKIHLLIYNILLNYKIFWWKQTYIQKFLNSPKLRIFILRYVKRYPTLSAPLKVTSDICFIIDLFSLETLYLIVYSLEEQFRGWSWVIDLRARIYFFFCFLKL